MVPARRPAALPRAPLGGFLKWQVRLMVNIAFSELDGSHGTLYRDVSRRSAKQIEIELNWLRRRHPTRRWFTVEHVQRQDDRHVSAA